MWGEIERSPVLAAPSFNNYRGLIASTTNQSIGSKVRKIQELPERELNDLCKQHEPLIKNLAARYMGKGIEFEDLRAAGLLGLAKALPEFDPERGITLGAFARHWIRGEMTALFKPTADAMSFGRSESLNVPTLEDDDDRDHQRDVAAPAPTIFMPDLSALTEKDRYIIQSRLCGETLAEIGKALGSAPSGFGRERPERVPRLKGS
jgi:RNA polymerase sigma factor (sigma-70 family)